MDIYHYVDRILRLLPDLHLPKLPILHRRETILQEIEKTDTIEPNLRNYLTKLLPIKTGVIKLSADNENITVNGSRYSFDQIISFPKIPVTYIMRQDSGKNIFLEICSDQATVKIPFNSCENFIPKVKPINSDEIYQELKEIRPNSFDSSFANRVVLKKLPSFYTGTGTKIDFILIPNPQVLPSNYVRADDSTPCVVQRCFETNIIGNALSVGSISEYYYNQRLLYFTTENLDKLDTVINLASTHLIEAFNVRAKSLGIIYKGNEFGRDKGINDSVFEVVKAIIASNEIDFIIKARLAEGIEYHVTQIKQSERAKWGELYNEIVKQASNPATFLNDRWNSSEITLRHVGMGMLNNYLTFQIDETSFPELFKVFQLILVADKSRVDSKFRDRTLADRDLLTNEILQLSNYECLQQLYEERRCFPVYYNLRTYNVLTAIEDPNAGEYFLSIKNVISTTLEEIAKAKPDKNKLNSAIEDLFARISGDGLGLEIYRRLSLKTEFAGALWYLAVHTDNTAYRDSLEQLISQSPVNKYNDLTGNPITEKNGNPLSESYDQLEQFKIFRTAILNLTANDIEFIRADLELAITQKNFNFRKYIANTFGLIAEKLCPTDSLTNQKNIKPFIRSGEKSDLVKLLNLDSPIFTNPAYVEAIHKIQDIINIWNSKAKDRVESCLNKFTELQRLDIPYFNCILSYSGKFVAEIGNIYDNCKDQNLRDKIVEIEVQYIDSDIIILPPDTYFHASQKVISSTSDPHIVAMHDAFNATLNSELATKFSNEEDFLTLVTEALGNKDLLPNYDGDRFTRRVLVSQAVDSVISKDLGFVTNFGRSISRSLNKLGPKTKTDLLLNFYMAEDPKEQRNILSSMLNSTD
jgi:hypothetical protein